MPKKGLKGKYIQFGKTMRDKDGTITSVNREVKVGGKKNKLEAGIHTDKQHGMEAGASLTVKGKPVAIAEGGYSKKLKRAMLTVKVGNKTKSITIGKKK